jgi:hypothetical protein
VTLPELLSIPSVEDSTFRRLCIVPQQWRTCARKNAKKFVSAVPQPAPLIARYFDEVRGPKTNQQRSITAAVDRSLNRGPPAVSMIEWTLQRKKPSSLQPETIADASPSGTRRVHR